MIAGSWGRHSFRSEQHVPCHFCGAESKPLLILPPFVKMTALQKGLNSDFKKGYVLALVTQGISQAAAAKLAKCSRSSVQRFLQNKEHRSQKKRQTPQAKKAKVAARRRRVKALITHTIAVRGTRVKKVRGRPRNDGTPRVMYNVNRSLRKLTHPSPQIVARALANEGNPVSPRTVHRDLKAMGYHPYVRRKVPFVTLGGADLRLKFARAILRKPLAEVRMILFSDEKWFDSNDNGVRFQWAPKGDRSPLLPKNFEQMPAKVFVWGVIGVGFRFIRVLHFDDGGRMKSDDYIEQCLKPLKRACQQKGMKGRLFMQDGARAHWTEPAQKAVERCGLTLLQNWPAHSADLNPIEHMWSIVQVAVAERGPFGVEELEQLVVDEFMRVPQAHVDNLALSFAKRCREVVRVNGKSLQ